MAEFLVMYNLFEFNSKVKQQVVGAQMEICSPLPLHLH